MKKQKSREPSNIKGYTTFEIVLLYCRRVGNLFANVGKADTPS
ncbi:hypothetical protein [Levilactobacillus koreensis]|nr:hypothetical protein [Levilactobacillus koreensis]